MQKFLTSTLLILGSLGISIGQGINVTGTVFDEDNNAIVGVEILVNAILSDSTWYFNTVATDLNGVYADFIPTPPNILEGIVTISLIDCDGTVHEAVFPWMPGDLDIVQDFIYCAGSGSGDSCTVVIIPEFSPNGVTTLFALSLNNNPVTFLWNTGETTQSIVPNAFGTYCVDIATADGCLASDCFEFVGDSIDCFVMIAGANAGSVPGDVLIATGYGVPPITYIWNTGEVGELIVPNGPGEYCVTMTDATDCVASECVVIDSIGCGVFILGSAIGGLEAIGYGVGSFTYEWSTGEVGPFIFPVVPGTYCVTMADANGCTSTACYTFDFIDCEVFVGCDPSGSLTAIAFGVEPITYLWDTGENTQTIHPAHEGEYCVTITDATGCTATGCGYFVPFDFCETLLFYQADSTIGSVGNQLFAFSIGMPPFTYTWSTGDTSESITLDSLVAGICVTVTDATGCIDSACTDELLNMCWSWIAIDYTGAGAQLTALSDILANSIPQSYIWSTGETTHTIAVTEEGEYCVTVTNETGCTSVACVYVEFGGFGDSCLAVVVAFPTSNGVLYTVEALAFGLPPFTYEWSNGETTSMIEVPDLTNDLCVVVTDAVGCVATACYINVVFPFCDVWIDAHPTDSAGVWSLTALGNALSPNWGYTWSNGATTSSILVEASGDYCVTVTATTAGDSCYAEACIFIDVNFGDPSNFVSPIQGVVHGNGFSDFTGTVGLYSMNANSASIALWSLVDSTEINESNYYVFPEVPPGIYALKATLDPSTDAGQHFFPTYYHSAVEWQHADALFHPNVLTVLQDIQLVPQSIANGVGVILGSLIDPDGLLPVPTEALRTDGIAGIGILLLAANGEPLRFVITNEAGAFTFEHLPWGTYRIKFEVVGIQSPEIWITIGPEQPGAQNVVLSTTELTTATNKLLDAGKLRIMPQPASDYLHLVFEDAVSSVYTAQVISINGKPIQEIKNVFNGEGNVTLDVSGLPSGLYLIRLISEQGHLTRKWIKL